MWCKKKWGLKQIFWAFFCLLQKLFWKFVSKISRENFTGGLVCLLVIQSRKSDMQHDVSLSKQRIHRENPSSSKLFPALHREIIQENLMFGWKVNKQLFRFGKIFVCIHNDVFETFQQMPRFFRTRWKISICIFISEMFIRKFCAQSFEHYNQASNLCFW